MRRSAFPTVVRLLAVLASAAALVPFIAIEPASARARQDPRPPYRILVTNDDGVRAPGLLALAQALRSSAELTIAAPAENQSGKGHSITTSDPIFVDTITLTGEIAAFSLQTTPASCVKVGVSALMSQRPDLVVSGINRGYNLGMVTYVSGTVGAAREAALMGIPAIAASLSYEESNYAPAAEIVRQVVEMLRKNGVPPGALLNVNVPPGAAGAIKGIQLTRQSRLTGVERFEEQKSPRGRRFFWSVWNEPTGDVEGTDVWAVEHGFAAVTPLRVGEFDPDTYEKWRAAVEPRR
jgi:5'-nucleotidase